MSRLAARGCRGCLRAPAARTRLTEQTPGLQDVVKAPEDESKFDVWDPANVSPFVAYLGTVDCPFSGEAFLVQGGVVPGPFGREVPILARAGEVVQTAQQAAAGATVTQLFVTIDGQQLEARIDRVVTKRERANHRLAVAGMGNR